MTLRRSGRTTPVQSLATELASGRLTPTRIGPVLGSGTRSRGSTPTRSSPRVNPSPRIPVRLYWCATKVTNDQNVICY